MMSREFEPYAFIRFFNEELTIAASLKSIESVFSKGVLVYHDPLPGITADHSVEIVKEWIARNPGFKLIHYPYPVIPAGSEGYRDLSKVAPEWRLDTYYEYALFWLKAYAKANGDYNKAWVVKIDADHIYSPTGLQEWFKYIKEDKLQRVNYFQFMINVLYYEHEVYAQAVNHNNDDHYCLKLTEFPTIDFIHKINESGDLTVYEQVPFVKPIALNDLSAMICSIHFKPNKILARNKALKSAFTLYDSGAILNQAVARIPGEPQWWSNENINQLVKNLDWQKFVQNDYLFTQQPDFNELFTNPRYRNF